MESSKGRVQVGLLPEIDVGESRVALIPDDVRKLSRRFAVAVEQDAGARAVFTNDDYEKAGATVAQRAQVLEERGAAAFTRARIGTLATVLGTSRFSQELGKGIPTGKSLAGSWRDQPIRSASCRELVFEK